MFLELKTTRAGFAYSCCYHIKILFALIINKLKFKNIFITKFGALPQSPASFPKPLATRLPKDADTNARWKVPPCIN
jgi:hypothetical protein